MYAEILTTLKINNDIAIIKIIGVFRWYKTRLKEKIANLFFANILGCNINFVFKLSTRTSTKRGTDNILGRFS